ncbi:TM2 domain-containing protein [Litorimonas taeanensis]|uniref:TM2 domain-containing protein n=1 Tax=Litorimonas taeanensis TaxID=568099 RepID=A0A420WL13_9PROT|nr:TM2 domain-containing protein [Litorimonas taeanensis]RKQ71680.1 TM2 domain-containing protein [Litorimonas taeanensis]
MNRYKYEREIIEMAASLNEADRFKFMNIIQNETLNPVALYGWNVWLGFLGIDRFIVGDILAGVLKLITLGGGGLWVLIDCFLIGKRTRTVNMEKIHDIYDFIVAHPK